MGVSSTRGRGSGRSEVMLRSRIDTSMSSRRRTRLGFGLVGSALLEK